MCYQKRVFLQFGSIEKHLFVRKWLKIISLFLFCDTKFKKICILVSCLGDFGPFGPLKC